MATIIDLIWEQVGAHPNAVALRYEDNIVTYSELAGQVDCLSEYLSTHVEGLRRPLVAILLNHSLDQAIAFLSVLKAGLIMLPLDPDSPTERNTIILEHARAELLLTDRAAQGTISLPHNVHNIELTALLRDFRQQASAPSVPTMAVGSKPAALIYTNADPESCKGVTLTHRQLHWYLSNLTRRPGFTHEHTMGLIHSPASPWALTELFLPLIVGGCCHILTGNTNTKHDKERHGTALKPWQQEKLFPLLESANISHLMLSVHALHQLLTISSPKEHDQTDPELKQATLVWQDALPKHIWIGGETLPSSIRNIAKNTAADWWHFCHIPEICGWITCHPVAPKDASKSELQPFDDNAHPLGTAMPGVHLHVLNRTGGPANTDEQGILWVGGSELTVGYHNEAGLSATTFANPTGRANERRFNTGMTVSKNAQGFLTLHRPSEDAITIHDYRLELREIENRLDFMLSVKRSAVRVIYSNGLAQLIVALELNNNIRDSVFKRAAIQKNLADGLPDYLMPSLCCIVPEIPTTSTGIPRRSSIPLTALEALSTYSTDKNTQTADDTTQNTDEPNNNSMASVSLSPDYVSPKNSCEKHIVHLFERLIGQQRISVNAPCQQFADSIVMASFCMQLRKTYLWRATQDEIPLLHVLNCQTLRQLAPQLLPRTNEHPAPSIPAATILKPIPLSAQQRQVWYVERYCTNSTINNMTFSLKISGTLHVQCLENAFNIIINKHEILRCAVASADMLPTLKIFPTIHLPLVLCQETIQNRLSHQNTLDVVSDKLREMHQRPIPLDVAPLMRCLLISVGPQEHVLGVTVHRLIWDEFTTQRFLRALSNSYRALLEGRSVQGDTASYNYCSYTQWQQRTLVDKNCTGIAFWRSQLIGFKPFPHALRTVSGDIVSGDTVSDNAASESRFNERRAYPFTINTELLNALKDTAKQHHTSVATLTLLAYFIILARYTNHSDHIIGCYAPNQPDPHSDDLLGPYTNLQPLRFKVMPETRLIHALERLRLTLITAHDHQGVAFDHVMQHCIKKYRKTAEPYRIPATFIYHKTPIDALTLGNARLQRAHPTQFAGGKELHVALENGIDHLAGTVYACEHLVDAGAVSRFISHLTYILQQLSEGQIDTLGSIQVLPEDALKQILHRHNRTPDNSAYTSITQLITQQAQNSVDKIAIVAAGEHITYTQLEQRSNQLAHLLSDFGIKPGDRCAICLERNTLLPITLMSIWKCGASILPIDPRLPLSFNTKVLQHTDTLFLITDSAYSKMGADLVSSLPNTTLLTRDILDFENHSVLTLNRPARTPQAEAYVFYVAPSNSTLRGVGVQQGAIVSFLQAMQERIDLNENDHFLSLSPITFDDHILEFWLPLMVGATLFIQDHPNGQRGLEILGAIEAHQITALQARPEVWSHIKAMGWSGKSELMGLIGGANCTKELITYFSTRLKKLWLCYGTTESTVWNTAQLMSPDTPATYIGQPLMNTQMYVLNSAGQAMPEGWTGELYISGPCLTHGYLKNRLETKNRFIDLTLEDGTTIRAFRTLDQARWQANGVLEYQGSTGHFVKVSGHRVNLSEIEHYIKAMPKVHHAVVRAHTLPAYHEAQLIAYVEPKPGSTLIADDVFKYLKGILPAHSVPEQIFCPFHFSMNGKNELKWSTLPAPEEIVSGRPLESWQPRSGIESQIAQIWRKILRVDTISRRDNFFALGGHSLLALTFLQTLYIKGLRTLTLKDLNNHTLAELCILLHNQVTQVSPKDNTYPSATTTNTSTATTQQPGIFRRVRKNPQP